ncbi:MAG: sigma-70 family RNA polymerase sigma factor [Planctomycetota bacterium]|nr:MAG: sigma-70 family RNA polymerase sigma factor [Planctomycetota bacterium]
MENADNAGADGIGPDAVADLHPEVYERLKALARSLLARSASPGQPGVTSLVNETYLRGLQPSQYRLRDRKHLFRLAARAMRCVLVDAARHHMAAKRGGGRRTEDPVDAEDPRAHFHFEILAAEEALTELARLSPRQAEVFQLRHYSNLNTQEVAETLNISPSTVKRDFAEAGRFMVRWRRGR